MIDLDDSWIKKRSKSSKVRLSLYIILYLSINLVLITQMFYPSITNGKPFPIYNYYFLIICNIIPAALLIIYMIKLSRK